MNTYQARLNKVRSAMQAQGLDCLVLTPGAGMRYVAGFSTEGHERLICLVVPKNGDCVFITPALNADQIRTNPAGFADVRAWSDQEGWLPTVRKAAGDLGLNGQVIAVDPLMHARFLLGFEEIVSNAAFRSASDLLGDLRIAKDAEEIAAMKRAAQITDQIITIAFQACIPERSELDVQMAMESAIYGQGAELSFNPIIGFGSNSALPHHHTGARKLSVGDLVVLDFGAALDGYHGDITRTVAVGQATDEAKRVYEIVYAAHHAALNAAHEGVTAESVDAAARGVIEEAGYGQYFIHRTGHGIGLEVHEYPNIVAGNKQILKPGMCFSIEPGIYLPGRFGVRLENIVAIAEDGSGQSLNTAIPLTLPVLDGA
ncbi:MAG TPA: Xaa-Pro peptidase family protein [Capsulimonadaceae bacterium]|nr:Xaa-Pro peptidase family protein [Capsulimonadaceae bacterium]